MAYGFLFRLDTVEVERSHPPTLSGVTPNWSAGDTIHLGRKTLRVVGVRDDDADRPPVLIVEDVADHGTS
jgi:hypothetical protein